LYEYIDKITKVEVPWEIILENAIHTTLAKSNTNRSWKNIHKRYRSLGITLPTYTNDTVLDKLYVFQDTSGSMSTEDQKKFVDILFQSINFFHSIVILQHDSSIVSTLELTRDNFEQQKEEVFKIHGRGGTSHRECFEYVEKTFFDEDEKIGIILMLTDYYSDIEYLWDRFEFHKYIPIKIICTEKNVKIPPHIDAKPIYI
jgi:predicted metal-dependent peptidase